MNYELILNAGYYTSEGISVTLTDSRKVSIGPWKEFQKRFITDQELEERAEKAEGIAIICGGISGGLEVIDIDLKYDITRTLWQRLQDSIGKDLLQKLTIVKTKSNGYHLYYRCSTIEGNLKLARRPASAEEQKLNPHIKVLVLIETRGEGGYVVAPPSEGYSFIQGDWTTIPILESQEREQLFSICRSFNEHLDEPVAIQQHDDDFGISPFDDYNQRGDVIGLLEKHGWKRLYDKNGKTILRRPGKDEGHSGDFWHEKRWFSVFTTSSQFEPNKAYQPCAIYCILECNNDWTKCVQKLASEGYGTDINSFKKTNNILNFIRGQRVKGLSDDDIQRMLITERKFKPSEAIKYVEQSKKPSDQDGEFWEYNDKGKLRIIKSKMIEFLEKNGFYLTAYDDAGNDIRLVNIKDGIIEESSIEKAKKCVYEYVRTRNGDVAEYLVTHVNLINESFLDFVTKIDLNLLRDDMDSAYYPFKNKIVKVTANGAKLLDYGSIDMMIWKSAKIDFEIELVDGYLNNCDINWTPETDLFAEFVYLISGQDAYRFAAACTTIGYLLHGFKDYTKPFALVFAEETDNDQKGGGTGKGIFVNALNYMANTETIDGKNFRHDKSFVWQRVKLDTRIIAIQDTRRDIDFEGFYSAITEGITVEKKGQQEIYIDYSRSPKFIFTTNHMINDLADHAKRRLKILPFSDFFGIHLTPQEHFKEQLFHGWDEGRWKLFYNYMFACVQLYLKNGIMDIKKTDAMRYKAIKSGFGDDFRNWVESYRNEASGWVEFRELYERFCTEIDCSERDFSKKRFKKALKVTAEMFQDQLEEDNGGPMNTKRVKYTKRVTHSESAFLQFS